MGTVSLCFAGIMWFDMTNGWVEYQREDYTLMKTFVDKLPVIKNDTIKVQVLPPSEDLHEKKSFLIHYNDEFNDPTFFRIWPIVPGIRVLYKENHPEISYAQINSLIKIDTVSSAKQFSVEVPGKIFNLDLNKE